MYAKRNGEIVGNSTVLDFARDTSAASVAADGNLQTFAENEARLTAGRGLVVEPSSHNRFPNSAAEGAFEGTYMAGASLPDGWRIDKNKFNTFEVVSIVDRGDYNEITFRGIVDHSAAAETDNPVYARVYFSPAEVGTEAGKLWSGSVNAQVTQSNTKQFRLYLTPRDASRGLLAQVYTELPLSWSRVALTMVMPENTAIVDASLQVMCPPGQVTEIVFRIALPQLEEGPPTSPIVTTPENSIVISNNVLPWNIINGAAVGYIAGGAPLGQLPTGWDLVSDTTSQVLALWQFGTGGELIDLSFTRSTAGTCQLRFPPIAAQAGTYWGLTLNAIILSTFEGADLRLYLGARNAGGSLVGSASYVNLRSDEATTVTFTVPEGAATLSPYIQFTGPGTVQLRLSPPILGLAVDTPATTGVRDAETAVLKPPIGAQGMGAVVIEAEDGTAGSVDNPMLATMTWSTCELRLLGGARPGIEVAVGGSVVASVRRPPAPPRSIVRMAADWSAGKVAVAFDTTLDNYYEVLNVAGFIPAGDPAVRILNSADGSLPGTGAMRTMAFYSTDTAPVSGKRTLWLAQNGFSERPYRIHRFAWSPPSISIASAWPEDITVDLTPPSMYGPSDPNNPGRDVIDPVSYAEYLRQVLPLRRMKIETVRVIDSAIAPGNPGAAVQAFRWLHDHAAGGVLTGTLNDTGSTQIQRYLTGCATAYLLASRFGIGTAAERATIESSFAYLADRLKAWMESKKAEAEAGTSTYYINNHRYFSGQACATVGLITGREDLIEWGLTALDLAIEDSGDAGEITIELNPSGNDDGMDGDGEEAVGGTLPAETKRLSRAAHYHNYAMGPLVALAEISIARGGNPYGQRDGQLVKMCEFVAAVIDDPSIVTAVQEATLGTGSVQDTSAWTGPNGWPGQDQISWVWLYIRRFPNSPAAQMWLPRLTEYYAHIRSSDMGMDPRRILPL